VTSNALKSSRRLHFPIFLLCVMPFPVLNSNFEAEQCYKMSPEEQTAASASADTVRTRARAREPKIRDFLGRGIP
jgi:hypothetical protein